MVAAVSLLLLISLVHIVLSENEKKAEYGVQQKTAYFTCS